MRCTVTAGGDLAILVVEDDALLEQPAHELRDVVHGVRLALVVLEHPAAGGELHLGFLMWNRAAESLPACRVIEVQVGDDHVLDARGVDADARERLRRQPDTRRSRRAASARSNPVSTTTVRFACRSTHTK